MKAIFKVLNKLNLSDEEVLKEVLIAETKMNSGETKLRFHLDKVIDSPKNSFTTNKCRTCGTSIANNEIYCGECLCEDDSE